MAVATNRSTNFGYSFSSTNSREPHRQICPWFSNAERTIVGSIPQIVDEVGGYVEHGFDEFIVPDFTFTDDTTERHATLIELFSALSASHG